MIDRTLFSPSMDGRANRKPYWLTALAAAVVIFVCAMVMALIVPAEGKTGNPVALIAMCVLLLPILYMVVVCIAVSIRRLHDRDKSAWWAVPYIGLPMIFDIITSGEAGDTSPLIILKIASLVITLWVLVDLGFLKGTTGPNRYGPDPLAPPEAATETIVTP